MPEEWDGNHTYTDNEIILPKFLGTQVSQDEHYRMTYNEDSTFTFSLDEEIIAEGIASFAYLCPRALGEPDDVDFYFPIDKANTSESLPFMNIHSLNDIDNPDGEK